MWTKIQTSHARKPPKWSFQMSATAWPAADHRELPLVPVAGRPGAAGRPGRPRWSRAAYSPIWIATGQMPGSGAALLVIERGGVAQDEDLGMARDGAVGLDDRAAHAVERRAEAS